jgi:hypothetical protein
MDNLDVLQDKVSDYIAQTLMDTYSFDFWLKTYQLERSGERDAILSMWDVFGSNLKPKLVFVVDGSTEDWTPCLSLYLSFRVTQSEILTLAALLQRDKVGYVRIHGLPNLPVDFDYCLAFDKRVIAWNALFGNRFRKP